MDGPTRWWEPGDTSYRGKVGKVDPEKEEYGSQSRDGTLSPGV